MLGVALFTPDNGPNCVWIAWPISWASTIVTASGPILILDVGANVDSEPSNLVHYAVMGSIYSEHVLKVPRPRVGLLNIGEEAEKGDALARATCVEVPCIRFYEDPRDAIEPDLRESTNGLGNGDLFERDAFRLECGRRRQAEALLLAKQPQRPGLLQQATAPARVVRLP